MTTLKIRPLANRVVLRPIEEVETMRGGLHIPVATRDKPQQGEVVATGPGRFVKGKRVPMELSPGQIVLFVKYNDAEFSLDNEKYYVIRESEVLAVLGT